MGKKYPCIKCFKSVNYNQNALLCVICNKWIHLSCSSVDSKFFNSDADWFCDVCLFKQLPFNPEEDVTIASKPCVPSHNTFHYDDIIDIYERLNTFNGLKIGHLNVCTLIKNIEEIESILVSSKIDILTILVSPDLTIPY